jgi:hypothetical protein
MGGGGGANDEVINVRDFERLCPRYAMLARPVNKNFFVFFIPNGHDLQRKLH